MNNHYPVVLQTLPLGYSHKDRLGRRTAGMPVERKVRPLNGSLAELDAEAHGIQPQRLVRASTACPEDVHDMPYR